MCLILLAWRSMPNQPLVVAANRDELQARSADRAAFWHEAPDILAGRDLEAGGTWMGVSRGHRFAAVTNYRGGRDASAVESRGALVTKFLAGETTPANYVAALSHRLSGYSGFNLLVCDRRELWWVSNRDGGARRLEPGIYGLGNFLLDTPEVAEPKTRFSRALQSTPALEPLFGVLAGSQIVSPRYGTRCSTILITHDDGAMTYAERAYDVAGVSGETVRYEVRSRA